VTLPGAAVRLARGGRNHVLVRYSAALTVFVLAGCSYPELGFTGDASDDAAVDATSDTFIPTDTFAPDDTLTPADTLQSETAESDTGESDTGESDTSQSDTTVLADTELDAADTQDSAQIDTAPDTPSTTGCTGATNFFCHDFDDDLTPVTGWDFQYFVGGGTLAIEPTGLSSPHAFRAEVSPHAENRSDAFLGEYVTAPTLDSIARYEAWIKLESAAIPSGQAFFIKFERSGGGVSLSIDPNGLFVGVVANTGTAVRVPFVPAPGVWFHVRFETKLRVSGGSFTLWINDMITPIATRSGISTVREDSTARLLIVGLYSSDIIAPIQARFDDVRFDFLP
jgi:hypothetical protein